MKNKIALLTITLLLTACAGAKREVIVSKNAIQDKSVEQIEKNTRIVYSEKYFNSAIRITPDNAHQKLANTKLPETVVISGTVTNTIDYDQRISIGKLHKINWLGAEYRGAWVFNGKHLFIARFAKPSQGFRTINEYNNKTPVENLLCTASIATESKDTGLIAQDIIWLSQTNSHGNKIKLAPVLTHSTKSENGKNNFIQFTDCAVVKFESEGQNE
jgi:hypothetical protein